MRKDLIILFLAGLVIAWGQTRGQIIDWEVWPHPLDTGYAIRPIPAKEEFLNQVLPLVVDSSFTRYYLEADAGRCEFVKYDFDEWAKYGLQEPVSIVILNELSKKCYLDSLPSVWKQDSLVKADCVDWHMAYLIAHPSARLIDETTGREPTKKAYRQLYRELEKQPPQEHIVYWFSKPEFTDDGLYAVMSTYTDCGKGCASYYIYLFRRGEQGWRRIGSIPLGPS